MEITNFCPPTGYMIAMKFGMQIHAPVRMYWNHVGDPFIFHPAPSSRQRFSLSEFLFYG